MRHNKAKRLPLTDAEIAQARIYADAGLSAAEIADLLQTTVAKIDYHVFAARRVEAHRRARADFERRVAQRIGQRAHVAPPPTEPSIADLCRPPVPDRRDLDRERQNLSIRLAGKRKPKPFEGCGPALERLAALVAGGTGMSLPPGGFVSCAAANEDDRHTE